MFRKLFIPKENKTDQRCRKTPNHYMMTIPEEKHKFNDNLLAQNQNFMHVKMQYKYVGKIKN